MSISKTVVQALEVVWVGIDVSKKKLDAAIWVGGKKYQTITVTNNAGGWAALLAWAKKVAGQDIELKFCMESTGDYHYEVGLYLTELEFHVSEVNPARIRFFGLEQGRLTKTDKADAKLIAQFGRERTPEAWAMRNPVRRNFFRLHRRRQQLMKMISMEDSRRECPQAIGQTCLRSIKIILKALRAELRAVEKDLAGIIQGDPILKHQSELIRSIPILEQASAILLLAEMPGLDRVQSASSYAAAAGVQSTSKKSGTKQYDSAPMSRCGRRLVRRGLFMVTLTGIRTMPELKDMYDRLRLRGKIHRQAMVACIRKLLMIVYGVLKHEKPYQSRLPARVSQAA